MISFSTRFVVFEEELNGTEPSGGSALSLKYESEEGISSAPPAHILESILSLDLCVNYTVDSSAKCFVVTKDDLMTWKNKNLLSN